MLSKSRCRLVPTVIGTSLMIAAACVARAESVSDPANDFLGTFIGVKNPDLDARSSEVTFNPNTNTFTFTGTVNGAVGTTAGGAWVWGLDRGQGTERFQPAFGAGVKFDSVVALLADGTGAFVDLLPASPVTTPLAAGSVHVSGNTISATVPLSMMPSEGFAATNYTWNFWPEQILGVPQYVSDFAPDARNATLTIVPEPSSVALLFGGIAAAAVMRSRRQQKANRANSA